MGRTERRSSDQLNRFNYRFYVYDFKRVNGYVLHSHQRRNWSRFYGLQTMHQNWCKRQRKAY